MKKVSAVQQIAELLRSKIAAEAPKESPTQEAAESAGHEAAESPEAEMMEHQETAESPEAEMLGGQGGELEGAGGGDDIEHLLAQLPPEQLEQLATALSADMQDPQAAQGGDDVAQLAHAIQAHLSQNPEASVDLPDHEQAATLDAIKSAAYIEGFIKQAMERGIAVEQAVTMYDNILSTTIGQLKQAELKGKQHKLDVDGDGKIEASDLKKLREGKDHKERETKVAAYYEGVVERAREYGIRDNDTLNIVKAANEGSLAPLMDVIDKIKSQASDAAQNIGGGLSDKLQGLKDTAQNYMHTATPLQLAGAGAGVGAAGALGLSHIMNNRDKKKQRLQMMEGMLEGGHPQVSLGQ